MEYRFALIDFCEGAFFLDAGNIWTLREDTNRVGGQISTNFWREFAIGGGFGARFDFDFFIIRLDIATQIRDPRLASGERWVWDPKDQYEADYGKPYRMQYNFVFGIGYPF